jgi:hypothetical protein
MHYRIFPCKFHGFFYTYTKKSVHVSELTLSVYAYSAAFKQGCFSQALTAQEKGYPASEVTYIESSNDLGYSIELYQTRTAFIGLRSC